MLLISGVTESWVKFIESLASSKAGNAVNLGNLPEIAYNGRGEAIHCSDVILNYPLKAMPYIYNLIECHLQQIYLHITHTARSMAFRSLPPFNSLRSLI